MKGKKIKDRYLLIRPLGKGGSGKVWLALDLWEGKERAVKRLDRSDERGEREAKMLERLEHPAIPVLFEWGEEDGFYLVMEYVPGETLEQVKKAGKVTAGQASRWGMELCRILEYLHGQDPPVFYGDMKPSNVILDERGRLHLIDFGSAQCKTEGGKMYGTPGYAAPEQYGGRVSACSDIYALGRMLLELAEGGGGKAFQKVLEKSVREKEEARYRSATALRWSLFLSGENFIKAVKKTIRRSAAALAFLCWLFFLRGETVPFALPGTAGGRDGAFERSQRKGDPRLCGEAIFWQPQKAEGYLRLYAYYEARGERQMEIYYVKEYQKAYPGALSGREKEILEEKMLLFPEKVGYNEEKQGRLEKMEDKKKKTILILVSLLAVLAVLFCVVLALWQGRQNEEKEQQERDQVEITGEPEQTEPEAEPEQTEGEPEQTKPEAEAPEEAVTPEPEEEPETTPAAVVTEEPAPPLKEFKIAIDPGHQGHGNSETEPIGPGASERKAKVASGTTGRTSGLAEYELNLQVSLKLREELETRGYEVFMIRESHDVNISNAERAQMAAEEGCDILVRIHANGSENTGVAGALTMAPSGQNPYVGSMAGECQRLCPSASWMISARPREQKARAF